MWKFKSFSEKPSVLSTLLLYGIKRAVPLILNDSQADLEAERQNRLLNQ